MRIYKKPIITGQQKILLNNYVKGKLKETELYSFLAARINEIPCRMIKNSTDEECILWFHKYSIVKTHPHEVINWFANYQKEYGKNRLQNRLTLKNRNNDN